MVRKRGVKWLKKDKGIYCGDVGMDCDSMVYGRAGEGAMINWATMC
jgi:hypothetical protein